MEKLLGLGGDPSPGLGGKTHKRVGLRGSTSLEKSERS